MMDIYYKQGNEGGKRGLQILDIEDVDGRLVQIVHV